MFQSRSAWWNDYPPHISNCDELSNTAFNVMNSVFLLQRKTTSVNGVTNEKSEEHHSDNSESQERFEKGKSSER